jgi:hypothetical protein
MTIVAFQGEHGAYSEEAIRTHFGQSVDTMPCHAFENIFEAVENGTATFGAVPVENSLAGSINKAYDLLLEHDLKVHWGDFPAGASQPAHHPRQRGQDRAGAQPSPGIGPVRRLPQPQRLQGHPLVRYPRAAPKNWRKNRSRTWASLPAAWLRRFTGWRLYSEGIEDMRHNYTRFFCGGQGRGRAGSECQDIPGLCHAPQPRCALPLSGRIRPAPDQPDED